MPRPLIVLICSALIGSMASSQTIEFALEQPAASVDIGRVEVTFRGVGSGDATVDLRLAAGEDLELGVRFRQAASVATVGNLVTTLAADASSGGRYAAALTARGVLGPVALRVRSSVSDGLQPLAPLNEGAFPPLAVLGPGSALFALEAGVVYRLSRDLILDAAPGLYLRGGAVGGRLDSELRFVRFAGQNDLAVLGHLLLEPNSSGVAAVGVGYTVNRRRAPTWTAQAWIGWGPGGVSPGVRLTGGERIGDAQLRLSLAAEPYRLDVWPYRLELGYTHVLGPGELHLDAKGGLEPGAGWRIGVRTGYGLPFEP